MAGVAAALVVAAVLLTVAGGSATTDLAEAAARAPTAPAPARADDLRLAVASDGIAFPHWAPRLGWQATGTREDEIDGRRAVTVTYRRGAQEVAYAILGRPAVDLPGDERRYAFTHDGRRGLAWIRGGRTCLLLGDDGVGDAELQRLVESLKYY